MKTLSHRSRITSVLVIGAILAFAGLGGTAQAGAAPTASDDGVTIVNATLLDSMQITLDRYSVPAGQVRFLVTNGGRSTHELVVLKTDLAPDQLVPNPDEPGKVEEEVHMGETGDIDGTRFNGLQLELGPGNYVIICNEPGHYMAGMRVAFTVYQPTINVTLDDHMAITLDRSTIYAGTVLFAVTNRGAALHEFVVLRTDTPADEMQADPEEVGKIEEEGNIGEIDGVDPSRFSGLQLHLEPGNYLIICNEPGHFAAGMHLQITVLAAPGGDE